MNCPEELIDSILEVIGIGVLCARAAAWQNDSQQCAVEADHIHNLPSLLREFSLERLRYYLDVEKQDFVSQAKVVRAFEPHWEILTEYVTHQTVQ